VLCVIAVGLLFSRVRFSKIEIRDGRGLSERAHQKVLEAAMQLFAQRGI